MRNQKLPYYVWNPWNLEPQPSPYDEEEYDDEDFIEEDTNDDSEE